MDTNTRCRNRRLNVVCIYFLIRERRTMKWSYESNKEQSTGYEEVLNKLKEYKKEDYIPLDEEGRKQMPYYG